MNIVLILGFKQSSNHINDELKGRMDTGINQFHELKSSFLLLSGGITTPYCLPECEIMNQYAIKSGVDPNKIICENKSLDTIGNFVFSREIIDLLYDIDMIFCVSSCYHIERMKYIFQKCYGQNFLGDFNSCYKIQGDTIHEKRSLNQAIKFFSDINDGDIETIKKKLFITHPLYLKKS